MTGFIAFMLQRIKDALAAVEDTVESPHEPPQVSPQVVKLLQILTDSMSCEQLQPQLGRADRKSFSQAYLQTALEQVLIEVTLPDKSQSKLQQYRITAAVKAALLRIKHVGA